MRSGDANPRPCTFSVRSRCYRDQLRVCPVHAAGPQQERSRLARWRVLDASDRWTWCGCGVDRSACGPPGTARIVPFAFARLLAACARARSCRGSRFHPTRTCSHRTGVSPSADASSTRSECWWRRASNLDRCREPLRLRGQQCFVTIIRCPELFGNTEAPSPPI